MNYTDNEATEKYKEAREHISQAIKCLSCLIVDECEGYDKFIPDFKPVISEYFTKLIEMRNRME